MTDERCGENNMQYIAHKDGEREQTMKDHLTGTAQLSGKFAAKFGKEEWGYCCGILHDIGKYSKEFQKKIQENTNEHVDHSSAGARLCMETGGMYQFMAYCIAGHHAGLPDYGNTAVPSSLCRRLDSKQKICDYQVYKEEIEIPELHTPPFKIEKNTNPDFSMSVFIRMIYSCLVDADFLDTESFMKNGQVERKPGESVELLLKKLESHISEWLQNTDIDTVNGRRTEILKHCLEEGKKEKGIFRLTVPTGGGKTIASLAFALRHAVEHQMDRVIYVIPYTSIIEQNAQVFREILGAENVLENHCNVDFTSSEELKPMQLASENWDKPVVVTTNAQFFESLFGNKSSKCRKIHNIANSVIVFDEAQMLPLDFLKPCTAVMQELVENYEASFVLCTATQPALDSFFPNRKNIMELCPRMKEQFRFFERVTYQNIGMISKEGLAERLQREKSALCIVNTRKRAQEFYRLLQGEGVYHLSTSMYPKHRKRVLKNVRERLKEKKKCILVATSLVEAGVDLDFACVYRQIAGVDSMIQAAGRCNREGKENAAESYVYIFDFDDMKTAQSQRQQIDIAKAILADHDNIADMESITDYFARLYHFRGESLDKKDIMGEFHNPEYNFAKVGKEFKLIEKNMKTIYIGIEPEAKILLREIKQQGASKERMRRAGQYCVQVFGEEDERDSLFGRLWTEGMVSAVSADMEDFYELTSSEQYLQDCGLNYMVDGARALFV